MSNTRSPINVGRLPWAKLALLVLCALFTTGGTFTCNGSTHDDDDNRPARR